MHTLTLFPHGKTANVQGSLAQLEVMAMKKSSFSRSAFFNPRVLICFALCSVGLLLALIGLSKSVTGMSAATTPAETPASPVWRQFRFSPDHRGVNPFETVLSPTTVGGLVLKWTFTASAGVYSSASVANGVVYTGSDDFNFYALDANTGALLWSFPTGDFVRSSAAVINGVVFVGSSDHHLYALNSATGALLW